MVRLRLAEIWRPAPVLKFEGKGICVCPGLEKNVVKLEFEEQLSERLMERRLLGKTGARCEAS